MFQGDLQQGDHSCKTRAMHWAFYYFLQYTAWLREHCTNSMFIFCLTCSRLTAWAQHEQKSYVILWKHTIWHIKETVSTMVTASQIYLEIIRHISCFNVKTWNHTLNYFALICYYNSYALGLAASVMSVFCLYIQMSLITNKKSSTSFLEVNTKKFYYNAKIDYTLHWVN